MNPLISVVMCAKNEEKYIASAIDSILQQSYKNLELVVIDDYSDDRTSEVVRSISDPRVRLHRKSSEARGLAASKNLGAELARGEFLAYQDADDFSHPERLELQLREARASNRPRVVGSWIEERIGDTRRIWRLPATHEEIVAGFKRSHNRVTFVSGTMLFPRSIALAVPNRVYFRYFEDWDQLCRMHEQGAVEFRNIQQPLFTYNIRPKGSKGGKRVWALYNVFERASRARRLAGKPEWTSAGEFESYIRRSPLEFLRWRGMQKLLEVKVNIEMARIRRLSEIAEGQSKAFARRAPNTQEHARTVTQGTVEK
jgi:glycosyltransferase involved in cell wall biosynthesis